MSRTDGFRMGSWLSGPEPDPAAQDGYPGKDLGFPQYGPGSLAFTGRRLAALMIDWLIGYGLAGLAMKFGLIPFAALSTTVLAVWFVIGVIALPLFGFTPGQLALGLMVIPVDGAQRVGVVRALVRGLLVALVVPALFTDTDMRGLQDRVTGTAVVRR